MRRLLTHLLIGGLAALLPFGPAGAEQTAATQAGQQPPAVAATPDAKPAEGEAGQAAPTPAAESPAPVAAPEPAPPPEPTLLININLSTQRMVVTEDGRPRYTWAISSGAYGYPTPVGTFQPSWMSKMWYSKQYDNAPMPHSIFFHRGAAIHATNSIHLLGTPASHGCVRLSPSNAAKLYAMVGRHGKDRTEIKVHGRPKYTAPRVARVSPGSLGMRYGYGPYGYGAYGYAPTATPPRYYMKSAKQRAAALKKRRTAVREYYSAY
jgi:lipoprotein-anchoring transpeptidase ErfK/SrfK